MKKISCILMILIIMICCIMLIGCAPAEKADFDVSLVGATVQDDGKLAINAAAVNTGEALAVSGSGAYLQIALVPHGEAPEYDPAASVLTYRTIEKFERLEISRSFTLEPGAKYDLYLRLSFDYNDTALNHKNKTAYAKTVVYENIGSDFRCGEKTD